MQTDGIPELYKKLDGQKQTIEGAEDEVRSSGPLRALAGLLRAHVDQADLKGDQEDQLYSLFGERVLPSRNPTAAELEVTSEEQTSFVRMLVAYQPAQEHPMRADAVPMDVPEDDNIEFHKSENDLKSAYMGWITHQEDKLSKQQRKVMSLPRLDGIKKEQELYNRAKLYGGEEFKKVDYGEYIWIKRVVQFADGVIRMECAHEYDRHWVTLSTNTELKDSATGVLPVNDRERLFVVAEQPPIDLNTVYVLRKACKP